MSVDPLLFLGFAAKAGVGIGGGHAGGAHRGGGRSGIPVRDPRARGRRHHKQRGQPAARRVGLHRFSRAERWGDGVGNHVRRARR